MATGSRLFLSLPAWWGRCCEYTRVALGSRAAYAWQTLSGTYNYKYVVVDKDNVLLEGEISGNFDVTENNYKVVAYYREIGARYDRLIGLGEANSVEMTN